MQRQRVKTEGTYIETMTMLIEDIGYCDFDHSLL